LYDKNKVVIPQDQYHFSMYFVCNLATTLFFF